VSDINKVTRPDLRQPDVYQLRVDETMLMWVEDGLYTQMGRVQRLIERHNDCDILQEFGCNVSKAFLAERYGSVDEAMRIGHRPSDCNEDLAFQYGELGRMHDMLFRARVVRNSPGITDPFAEREAEQKLRALQAEVSHREHVAKTQTGEMPVLDEKTLNELEVAEKQKTEEFKATEKAKEGFADKTTTKEK
jgi:hypothetical protein